MTATVTDYYKRVFTTGLYNDFKNYNVSLGDSSSYYLGIGRVEAWDSENSSDIPITPNPSKQYAREFQHSLQSIKKIDNLSYVVRRKNWVNGTIYQPWDDLYSYNTDVLGDNDDLTDEEDIQYPFYTYTNNSNVYVCLKQGKTGTAPRPSIFEPNHTTLVPQLYDDGYVWKFLYTISAIDTRRYLTSDYMPVKFVDSAVSYETSTDQSQKANQDQAIDGEILRIAVDDGGGSYSTSTTVAIDGDGTGATATLTFAGGVITNVTMTNYGSGYTYASARLLNIGSGAGAKLRPVIAPPGGMGADPREDLHSGALMFSVSLEDSEGGKFLVGLNNDFRQFGIIKNPVKNEAVTNPAFSGDSAFTSIVGIGLKTFKYSGISSETAVVPGVTLTGGNNNGSKLIVDYHDTIKKKIWYHQNSLTGFQDVTGEQSYTPGGISDAGNYSDDSADFYRYGGEVLYIDNSEPFVRAAADTQDVKIVIDI
jgi:hypothetical protein